jgi:hypothetical protein
MSWQTIPDYIRIPAQEHYSTTLQLQSSYEDLETATDLLLQLNVRTPVDVTIQDAAQLLLDWSSRYEGSFLSKRRCIIAQAVQPSLSPVPVIHPTDVYDSMLITNLRLHRSVQKSSLSQQIVLLESELSKESLEEEERRKWAIRMAEFIREAQLPVCEVIEMTSSPVEAWHRLFGARRAKTLRNRAKAWRRVFHWLMMVH